jgi:hypothetical protein
MPIAPAISAEEEEEEEEEEAAAAAAVVMVVMVVMMVVTPVVAEVAVAAEVKTRYASFIFNWAWDGALQKGT